MNKSIDLAKAFNHVFEDDDWLVKVMIGCLVCLVPILGFAAVGYELQVVRNVAKGQARPMPSWDDLSTYFLNGLQLGIARLVLVLPAIVGIFFAMATLFLVPFSAIFLTSDLDSSAGERIMGIVMVVCMLIFFAGLLFGMLYSLVIGFLLPAMTANFARRGTFASCFAVREIFDFIRRNSSNYLMVWLAGILAGLIFAVVYMVVNFIPCLGALLAIPLSLAGVFYIYMVNGHALGQAIALDPSMALAPAPDQPAIAEGAT